MDNRKVTQILHLITEKSSERNRLYVKHLINFNCVYLCKGIQKNLNNIFINVY